MPVAIFTIGVPGSGKSSWAKTKEGFCVIERDIIRNILYGVYDSVRKTNNYYSSKDLVDKERVVDRWVLFALKIMIMCDRNIIISDTNLNIETVKWLWSFLARNGYDVFYKSFLGIPKEKYWSRISKETRPKLFQEKPWNIILESLDQTIP